MGAEVESIGGVSVQVVGNYAPLLEDLAAAQAAAAKGGESIAEGLNKGASASSEFEAKLAALYASGNTLAEALEKVQAASQDMAGTVGEAGAAAQAAATQLDLFDQAAMVPYADAAGQLNLFSDALEPIPGAATQAAKATEELGEAEDKVAEHSHHAAGALGEVGEKLVAFGEALAIVEGLKEFGLEALHASDNITRTTISLTALTGSADKAKETIEEIEALGIKDGLSLPGLLQASTRMTNLLGAGAPIPELLAKIANGAAVMGKDIGAAADSFDRLATMGSLGARQLMPLGLNLEQVAKAMNHVTGESDATARNVQVLFKAMDQSERIEVLSVALDRLGGIAEQTAQKTFGGQWQILANQFEQVMRNVGDALIPVITGLTDFMKVDVLPTLKELTEGFNALPAPVRETAVVIGLLAAAVVPITLAIGGFGLAMSAAAGALAPVIASVVSLGGALTGAGASYSAMLATGIASAAVWIGLAAAIVEVVVAYRQMTTAQDLAAKSGIDAANSLAAYEIALKRHGVNIDEVRKLYDAGKLSTDQYIARLGELRDEFLKAHPVIQEHGKAVASTGTITEAAALKMQALRDAVAQTAEHLEKVTGKYKDHKATVDDVAKAYDAWQGATATLKTAQTALLPVITNVHHATKEFVDLTGREFPDAAKQAANAVDAFQIKLGLQNEQIAIAQKYLDIVLERYRVYHDNAGEVVKALDALTKAQAAVNAEVGKLPDASEEFKKWEKGIVATSKQMWSLIPPLQAAPPLVRTLAIDLYDLGLRARDAAGEVTTKLLAAFEDLATKQKPTLEEAHLAWAKVQQDVNRLAKYDLPEALKVYGEYEALLKRIGATQGEVLAVRKEYLELEIRIAEQTGADATKQIVGLQNVKLAQGVLYDQTHLLGDLYVNVTNDALKGFEEVGKSVADAIVDQTNLGDAFIATGKKIGKTILEDIVGTYFKALKDEILKSTGLLDGLTASLHKFFGATAKSAAGAAADDAGPLAAGGAKDVVKSAGGLGGGGGSMGMVGAIADVGTLISSIVGNFQMAKIETTMNAVEHNTRFLEIIFQKFAEVDVWQRHREILEALGNIFTRLGEVGIGVLTAGQAVVTAVTESGTAVEQAITQDAEAAADFRFKTGNSVADGILNALLGPTPKNSTAAAGIPHMAEGGPVIGDGVRYLHDGEYVVPRAEVPTMGAMSTPSPAVLSSSTTVNAGSNVFHVYEASNPRETARQIAEMLKRLSPRHAAYAQ